MPKLKTKSGAKKRFSLTGTGKVRANQANKQHGMIKRTNKQIREQRGTTILSAQDAKIVKRFIPYGYGSAMARVKRGVTSHARHRKVVKAAKGFRGRSNSSFRIAIEKVEKSLQYAYRDRRVRKRQFRALWIQRINAAAREHGLTYGRFINGLKLAGVEVDRKVLADLAVKEPGAFGKLAEAAQTALATAPEKADATA